MTVLDNCLVGQRKVLKMNRDDAKAAALHYLDRVGMPVATVAIDGAANAALLAVQILSVSDAVLADKLAAARARMKEQIAEKDSKLQALILE